MSSSNGEVVRRPNVSTKRVKRIDYDGDSTRIKDRRRRRHLREERNRRVALVFVSSLLFLSAVIFLSLRPTKKHRDIDTLRYERVKGLRDAAALSGGRLGKGLHRGKMSIQNNSLNVGGMRYLDPRQLAPLPGEPREPYKAKRRTKGFRGLGDDEWQSDAELPKYRGVGPKVDYTKHKYLYPELIFEPPNDGSYPPLEQMSTIFERWGQDDLDTPPGTLVEVLQHFDYQDTEQLKVRACLIIFQNEVTR
jgi:hypothetical protein